MKIIMFINLLLLSLAASAIEFYRCIDKVGKIHLTTLPKSSLNANCQQKIDYHTILLEQDYLNLSNKFKQDEALDGRDVNTDIKDKVNNR